ARFFAASLFPPPTPGAAPAGAAAGGAAARGAAPAAATCLPPGFGATGADCGGACWTGSACWARSGAERGAGGCWSGDDSESTHQNSTTTNPTATTADKTAATKSTTFNAAHKPPLRPARDPESVGDIVGRLIANLRRMAPPRVPCYSNDAMDAAVVPP